MLLHCGPGMRTMMLVEYVVWHSMDAALTAKCQAMTALWVCSFFGLLLFSTISDYDFVVLFPCPSMSHVYDSMLFCNLSVICLCRFYNWWTFLRDGQVLARSRGTGVFAYTINIELKLLQETIDFFKIWWRLDARSIFSSPLLVRN